MIGALRVKTSFVITKVGMNRADCTTFINKSKDITLGILVNVDNVLSQSTNILSKYRKNKSRKNGLKLTFEKGKKKHSQGEESYTFVQCMQHNLFLLTNTVKPLDTNIG